MEYIPSPNKICFIDAIDSKNNFTNPKIVSFLTAISMGMNIKRSADFAGIDKSTIYLYVEQAEKDLKEGKETKYTLFKAKIDEAISKFQAYNLQQIINASKEKKHWAAAAWLLERAFPEEFGRKEKNEGNSDEIVVLNDDVPKIK